MNKLLEDTQKRGSVYCVRCGIFFNDIIDTRKHNVEQHYDYVLSQCHDNKQLLLDSIKEFDGLPLSYQTMEIS